MSEVEGPPQWVRLMAGIYLSLWEDEVAPSGTREAGTMPGQFINDYFLSPCHCQVLSWTAYLEN